MWFSAVVIILFLFISVSLNLLWYFEYLSIYLSIYLSRKVDGGAINRSWVQILLGAKAA